MSIEDSIPQTLEKNQAQLDIPRITFDAMLNYPRLDGADYRVYAALLEIGEDAYRSEIAKESNLPEWKVSQGLSHLEIHGIISIERRRISPNSRATKNFYTFLHLSKLEIPISDHYVKDTTFTIKEEREETDNQSLANHATPLSFLNDLNINPHIRQPFDRAPLICQQHTPQDILLDHDHEHIIIDNLEIWRNTSITGIDITHDGLDKPALIWVKIVEGQSPPGADSLPEPPTRPNSSAEKKPDPGDTPRKKKRSSSKSPFGDFPETDYEPAPISNYCRNWQQAIDQFPQLQTQLTGDELIELVDGAYVVTVDERSLVWLEKRLGRQVAGLAEVLGARVEFQIDGVA